jgi:hypothetical protein
MGADGIFVKKRCLPAFLYLQSKEDLQSRLAQFDPITPWRPEYLDSFVRLRLSGGGARRRAISSSSSAERVFRLEIYNTPQ